VTETAQKQIALIQQEVAGLSFTKFEQDDALALGKTLLALAETASLRVAIGVDLGEQVMFRAALPGTTADYQTWIDRKFNSVRRFGKSSMELELTASIEPGFATERALDPARFVLCGGAVPILIGKTVVGCIGCAGLASIEDHRLVVRALDTYHKAVDAQ